MTITQLCEKVNVYCAKLNSIVTARGGIYFFILGFSIPFDKLLKIETKYCILLLYYNYEIEDWNL